MRIVAAALSGAYALLVMTILLPWDAAECVGETCVVSDADAQFFPVGFTVIGLTVPNVILLLILLAVLGARATRDPEAGAVLAALGQTRGTAIRRAAIQGLRDSAIAVGGAFVIAGGIHVAMLAGTGLNPFTTGAGGWGGRAVLGLVVAALLVLAHALTAARRPRTPVDALTADMQDDVRPRPSFRTRALLAGPVFLISAGVIVWLAVSLQDTPWEEIGFVATNAAGIAMFFAWAGALGLGLWVFVPWLRSRRGAVIGAAAAAAGRDSRMGAVLATYAGDRSRASARIVTVLAGLGFLLAAVPSQDQPTALGDGFLSAVLIEGEVHGDRLADQIREVDGVDQVIVAQATMPDNEQNFHFVFGVTPESVRDRDPGLARALEDHPQAAIAPLWNGQVQTDVLGLPLAGVDEIYPMSTCCGVFVNTDFVDVDSLGPGFIVFATEDADREAVAEEVDRITSDVPGLSGFGSITTVHGSGPPLWNVLINLMLVAVVLVLPLTMLAIGAVRRRRADDATLTALGATPKTMRTAIVIETAVVSAFAITGGAVVGAATRILMTALQQGRLSLGPVVLDSPLATGFSSLAWGLIATVVVASVAIMTIAAFITAWATGRSRARAHPGATPTPRQPAPLS